MVDEDGSTTTDQTALLADADDFNDEWADYVPEGIHFSEERQKELREEHERYIAELFEEIGEPSEEEMARAEAWWRPIEEHLTKNNGS